MTFQEMQNEVVDRLGVTDAKTWSRIGRAINQKYREVSSAVGLATTGRTTVTANTSIGSNRITFTGQKIYIVYDANFDPPNILNEISMDDMRANILTTEPAQLYAIELAGASTITLVLNCEASSVYTYTADVLSSLTSLSGADIPAFPADFHDVLIEGAQAIELRHRGDYSKAAEHEVMYQTRLADLRFFLAKSGWLSRFQGKSGWGNYPRWSY